MSTCYRVNNDLPVNSCVVGVLDFPLFILGLLGEPNNTWDSSLLKRLLLK